jgi:hypothetical protein
MKALSLWEPWASAVVLGIKKIETRSWDTRHHGILLIHAAKHPPEDLPNLLRHLQRAFEPEPLHFNLGYLIGMVNVVRTMRTEHISTYTDVGPSELEWGDYRPGRYGWFLTNPCPFKQPIPYRGRQGLFEVPEEIVKGAR